MPYNQLLVPASYWTVLKRTEGKGKNLKEHSPLANTKKKKCVKMSQVTDFVESELRLFNRNNEF